MLTAMNTSLLRVAPRVCAMLVLASVASAQTPPLEAPPAQPVTIGEIKGANMIPTVDVSSLKRPAMTTPEYEHYRMLRAERAASVVSCAAAGTGNDECLSRHGGRVIGMLNVRADVKAELLFQQGRSAGENAQRFAKHFSCVNTDFTAKDEDTIDAIKGNLNLFDSRTQYCLDMVNAGCDKACLTRAQLFSDAKLGATPVEDMDGDVTVENRLPAPPPAQPAPPAVHPTQAAEAARKWQTFSNPCDSSASEGANCWDR